jgi:hypothetical protein
MLENTKLCDVLQASSFQSHLLQVLICYHIGIKINFRPIYSAIDDY